MVITVSIASKIISILNFGIVESISKLDPSSTNLDIISLGYLDNLFGVIVGSANGDIIEDISDCRLIIRSSFDSKLANNFI